MTTQVLPHLPPQELKIEVDATAARELRWLLNSLQDTFASLKSGFQECEVLLAPVEPGSTLVVSSSRSERVKGIITRIGTRVVKSDINLQLQTLPPTHRGAAWQLKLATKEDSPALGLSQLSKVRNLINQSLDVVDISTWTGDAQDANFISGQLRLLHDLLQEARQTLKGSEEMCGNWWENPLDDNAFDPPLPPNLSLHLSIYEGSVLLMFRTLHHINPATPTSFTADALSGLSIRQRLGLASRLPDHDESDLAFIYRGQEVKVREKVRVESQDPSLMAIMAKLSALDHTIGIARHNLTIVMGQDEEDL